MLLLCVQKIRIRLDCKLSHNIADLEISLKTLENMLHLILIIMNYLCTKELVQNQNY